MNEITPITPENQDVLLYIRTLKKEINELFSGDPSNRFQHGYTFGGLPVGCMAGLANLRVMERTNVLAEVPKKGAFVLAELQKIKANSRVVGDVRGVGLLMGVELVKDLKTKEGFPNRGAVAKDVADAGMENNVHLSLASAAATTGSTIFFAPPLNINYEEAGLRPVRNRAAQIAVSKKTHQKSLLSYEILTHIIMGAVMQ